MWAVGETRERPAPRSWSGHWLSGPADTQEFTRLTLIIAVKPSCDGCVALLKAPPSLYGDIDLLFVTAESADEPAWSPHRDRIVVSPALLTALDVRWPPFWVLVDPERGRVVREGVPFGPAQIAEVIADLR